VLDPLAAGEDKLAGLHANTQIPKLVGAARLYELTGEAPFRDMSAFFWDRVANHHSYAMGGNSDHESFGPPDKLNGRVSPFTAESCNTYNMLKLTRHLFTWDAAAQRRTSMSAPSTTTSSPRRIRPREDGVPHPRLRRLVHALQHGERLVLVLHGHGVREPRQIRREHLLARRGGLYVTLFIPSELTWREKGVTLRLETRYPKRRRRG
jgi:DUF1680 family protein